MDNAYVSNLLEKYKKYGNPGMATVMQLMGAVVEKYTEGAIMTDSNGKQYIDFLSGHGAYSLGYRHPKVIAAVTQQLYSIPMSSSKSMLNETVVKLLEKLAHISPGKLTNSFLCNSGTEAVEGALKLARIYTGRKKIVSTINGFHGKTFGALAASGKRAYKKPFKPMIRGFWHVPYGNIEAMDKTVDEFTAAVIIEPIQGEGGVIVPPDGYLKAIREICDKNDALLIMDEVQTGLGRTGYMFGCNHEMITPDIMCMAKALGGGVMPIGAFIATPEVFQPFAENPTLHSSTFGGNPLACAAACAAIDVIIEEKLALKAKTKGEALLGCLKLLQAEFPQILTDVRGRGLLIGLEFANEGIAGNIILELENQGFLALYMLNNPKVIRIEPPLIIEYPHIKSLLGALYDAVKNSEEFLDN